MSNKFTKTSLRGFTLIELLVVIAIIGLLSTAIMGPVQTGLKKGRDTRKISDITQVQGALLQYAGDNSGAYPATLLNLAPTYMATDTKMMNAAQAAAAVPAVTAPAQRDKFMYITYADPASILVSYHLGVALENQNASLQGDVDCGDTVTGVVIDEGTPLAQTVGGGNNNPCTQGLDGGTVANSNYDASGAGNPAASAATEDFGGKGSQEDANGICSSALSTCVFDVQPK